MFLTRSPGCFQKVMRQKYNSPPSLPPTSEDNNSSCSAGSFQEHIQSRLKGAENCISLAIRPRRIPVSVTIFSHMAHWQGAVKVEM